MSNALEVLLAMKRERKNNRSKNTGDRRFGKCPTKGVNSYARILDEPGVIEQVDRAISEGETLHGIFTSLVEKGVFAGENHPAFFRAYQRRKGIKPKKRGEKRDETVQLQEKTAKIATNAPSANKSVASHAIEKGAHEDGEFYERDGKKYVMWTYGKGENKVRKEIHIPEVNIPLKL